MTTDLAIPESPAALDHVSDPGAVMLALVEQAKALLLQASGIEGIAVAMETKSRAEAIEVYVQQKNMGHDAEMAAGEIVRRAERRIGELIRAGQLAGEITSHRLNPKAGPKGDYQRVVRGETVTVSAPRTRGDMELPSPAEVVGAGRHAPHAFYALTDGVTEEKFEQAIDSAKADGNLSRANVMRKIIGNDVPPKSNGDRHELLYKVRHFDSVRFVRESVRNAPDMTTHLVQVDWTALPLDEVADWIGSLDSSIRFLTTLRKNLKELIRD